MEAVIDVKFTSAALRSSPSQWFAKKVSYAVRSPSQLAA